jgi:serine/threonine protein kinase
MVRRELATASVVKGHPNVVSVFGCVVLPAGIAVVMEMLPEGTLSELLLDSSTALSWLVHSSLFSALLSNTFHRFARALGVNLGGNLGVNLDERWCELV